MTTAQLSLKQLKEAVKKLSPADKLELNEVIWSDNFTVSVEHQNLVNERIKSAEENPEEMIDWEVAVKMLHS